MTPAVLRSGPEAGPQAPQRERASEPSGDFAALFGALRQAEPPRLPEPPRNEAPRAAAPAAPDRPIDEAPRAELPAAPETADKPLRPRNPRQPAPAGLPETVAGTTPAGEALDWLSQPAVVVDALPAPAADKDQTSLDPTALPSGGLPNSPIEIAAPAGSGADEGGDAMTKPVAASVAAGAQAEPMAAAGAAESRDAPPTAVASQSAEPGATPTALPTGAEATPTRSPGGQDPSGMRGSDALPALSALPGGQAIAASPAGAAGPAQAALALPPQHPGFAEELGAQLSVWTRQGVQQAELRLNPAELGPVQVRIQIEGQQALVRFVADAAPTRDALEAAMPELAAALQREGLQLSGGSVQSQAQHQHQQQQQRDGAAATAVSGPSMRGKEAAVASPARPASQRLLDLYA